MPVHIFLENFTDYKNEEELRIKEVLLRNNIVYFVVQTDIEEVKEILDRLKDVDFENEEMMKNILEEDYKKFLQDKQLIKRFYEKNFQQNDQIARTIKRIDLLLSVVYYLLEGEEDDNKIEFEFEEDNTTEIKVEKVIDKDRLLYLLEYRGERLEPLIRLFILIHTDPFLLRAGQFKYLTKIASMLGEGKVKAELLLHLINMYEEVIYRLVSNHVGNHNKL